MGGFGRSAKMKLTKLQVIYFSFPVLIVGLSLVTWIDYSRVKSSKAPIFTFASAHYSDGGSVKLSGIFYSVTDMNRISMMQLEDSSYRELTRIGYTYDHSFLPLHFNHSKQVEGDIIRD